MGYLCFVWVCATESKIEFLCMAVYGKEKMTGIRFLDAIKKFIKWFIVSGLCAAVVAVIFLFLLDYHEMCGKDHIKDLCYQYEQNMIAGTLCQDLCQTKTLTLDTCLSTQPDKGIYEGTWEDKKVILKIRNDIESYSFDHLQTQKDHKNEISSTINMLFGECENCSRLTEQLVYMADVDNDGQLSVAETMTMVTMLRTPEPSMLLVLNDSKHLPEMYGYCGALYAVEKIPVIADAIFGYSWNLLDIVLLPSPLEHIEKFLKNLGNQVYKSLKKFQTFKRWVFPFVEDFKYLVYTKALRARIPSLEERFDFFMSLLDTILALSTNQYGMFQSCDSHLGNFGLSKNLEVKIIDGDQILPLHHLKNILGVTKCEGDRDCRIGDFHECSSKCNKSVGYCTMELENQNLHNICLDSLTLVFKNIHKDFEHSETRKLICLEKAVSDLAVFCFKLPPGETALESQKTMEIVKQKLLNISFGEFKCP